MSLNKIKKLNKSIFFSAIISIMLFSASIMGFYIGWNQVKKDILIVLNFHGIKNNVSHPWETTSEILYQIINKLKHHDYKPLSPWKYDSWKKGEMESGRRFMITFDDGLKSSYNAIKDLYKNDIEAVFFIVTDFLGKPRYINNAEVKELAEKYKCKIGIHGKRHYEYTKILAEGGNLIDEIKEAKTILSSISGQDINWFAYPFGVYNASVTALIASNSSMTGFTIKGREVEKADNRLTIPRIMYLNGGAEDLEAYDSKNWAPPKTASKGSLSITLSSLVLFLSSIWFFRAIALIKIKNKYKA